MKTRITHAARLVHVTCAGGATGYFSRNADKKQDRNALAKPLLSILQEVEGGPIVKSKVLHLFR